MKTIEEKAKAYDEAIERAKEVIRKMNMYDGTCIKEDIEDIFPQLAESEDERIRKMLIDRLLRAEELTDGLRDLLITYLEKQKEQKLTWSEEDEREYNYIMSYLDTAPKGKQNHAAKWLKKRRPCPSWKPSEEQMKALIDCTIGNEYDVHALVRLWAELKNL